MKAPNVNRFIAAQANGVFDIALEEIRSGKKQSHWIWYIFPQIYGLGHSQRSRTYALTSLLEAKAYWENDSLRGNLKAITNALLGNVGRSAVSILGFVDAKKVRSCMTLFDIVSPHDIFRLVLEQFYEGKPCRRTLHIVEQELKYYMADSAIERYGLNISFESCSVQDGALATLVDCVMRGRSVSMMLNRYLWHSDLMSFRLSAVERLLSGYLSQLDKYMLEETDDSNKLRALLANCGKFYSAENAWEYADCIDNCIAAYSADSETCGYLHALVDRQSLLPKSPVI
jgi:uncharacterized protein (DUF1810 family)